MSDHDQSPATSDDVGVLADLLHPWLDGTTHCPYRPASLCVNTMRSRELARTLTAAGYRRPSPDAGAEVTAAQARAYEEGYNDAATMARCYGHIDHWPDEDEPRNPYRVESAAAPREAEGHAGPYEPCVVGADGRCTRWSHRHDEPEPAATPREAESHTSDYGTPARHPGNREDCRVCPPLTEPTRDDGQPAPLLSDDEQEALPPCTCSAQRARAEAAERNLAREMQAASDLADEAGHLRAERDALRERLAAVEALADEWATTERSPGCMNAAHRLRVALTKGGGDS